METLPQCCYHDCGSCREPDEHCNTEALCEADQSQGGCSGTWLECPAPAPTPAPEPSMQCCYHDCGSCREPDEFCNTEALCESTDSQQGGCSGTWLQCPAQLVEVPKSRQASETADTSPQCCYHDCGSCREPDEFCNTEALCEADQSQGGCSGTWLECPAPAPTPAPEPTGQCCYHDCGSCREPDEHCNTEALCESTDSQQGGCSGTWLQCP